MLKSENKKFFLQKIKEKEKYPFFLEIIAQRKTNPSSACYLKPPPQWHNKTCLEAINNSSFRGSLNFVTSEKNANY